MRRSDPYFKYGLRFANEHYCYNCTRVNLKLFHKCHYLVGIIGLLWLSLFHFKGFRDFVITELSERRRNVACALGLGVKAVHPEHLVNQYREAKREGNEDWGFDVIVDCTGNPKAIEQEFTFLRRGMICSTL